MAKRTTAETTYYVNNTNLAIIAKLLYWNNKKEIKFLIRSFNIDENQIKLYCNELSCAFPFLKIVSDSSYINISIKRRNKNNAEVWLKEYVRNLVKNNLEYEYRYDRNNPENYKSKQKSFIKSIDKTRSTKSYIVLGTKHFDVLLALHLFKPECLNITNISISAYSEEIVGNESIYTSLYVEEVDEEYDVLQDPYLNIATTINIKDLKCLFNTKVIRKNTASSHSQTTIEVDNRNSITNKYKLTKEEINIISAKLALLNDGKKGIYKEIGKILTPKLTEGNVKQKVLNIKNKLCVESLDGAIRELDKQGFQIPPFNLKS